MNSEIGNFEESEFRLNDEQLIKFYGKFNLQQLRNLYIIMTNVTEYAVSAEIDILKKYIEKKESEFQYNEDEAFYDKLDDYNQDKPLDNILKRVCVLNNHEVKFLYVMNHDANHNFKHIVEYYDYELGEKEEQYNSYVNQTDMIESKLYTELVKINSGKRILLKFKQKSLNN